MESRESTSRLCDAAARLAAKSNDVPQDVMLAIARVETGRDFFGQKIPWPWVVNIGGKGYWFSSESEARSFIFSKFKKGARNFDVGCFQINYKWHGSAFKSIEEMFDPKKNAMYAASFIVKLKREFGGWTEAVGAYHSRNRKYADNYVSKYEIEKSQLNVAQTAPDGFLDGEPISKSGSVPLFGYGKSELGSLVYLGSENRPSLLISID